MPPQAVIAAPAITLNKNSLILDSPWVEMSRRANATSKVLFQIISR
jgi:hypothetical protein